MKENTWFAHANGGHTTRVQTEKKRKEKSREERERERVTFGVNKWGRKVGPYPVESVETVEWLLCVE